MYMVASGLLSYFNYTLDDLMLLDTIPASDWSDIAYVNFVAVKSGENENKIEDESGKKIKFFLVGSKEVDMKAMKISDESPIGKACIGRKLGEEVSVEAPAGVKKYKIVEIDK